MKKKSIRLRKPALPALRNLNEVDQALKHIGEHEIALSKIKESTKRGILALKNKGFEDSQPHKDAIAKLDKQVKKYVKDHANEFNDNRSIILNYGKISIKETKQVQLGKNKAALIDKLKDHNMDQVLVEDTRISKERLKQYDKDTLESLGIKIKRQDSIHIDTDKMNVIYDVR